MALIPWHSHQCENVAWSCVSGEWKRRKGAVSSPAWSLTRKLRATHLQQMPASIPFGINREGKKRDPHCTLEICGIWAGWWLRATILGRMKRPAQHTRGRMHLANRLGRTFSLVVKTPVRTLIRVSRLDTQVVSGSMWLGPCHHKGSIHSVPGFWHQPSPV